MYPFAAQRVGEESDMIYLLRGDCYIHGVTGIESFEVFPRSGSRDENNITILLQPLARILYVAIGFVLLFLGGSLGFQFEKCDGPTIL